MSIALLHADKQAKPSELARSTAPTIARTVLASALPGHFVCTAIDDSALSPARMKSLGICVGRPLELVSTGDPMIVRVCGTTVGLSKQLAAAVTVDPQSTTADV